MSGAKKSIDEIWKELNARPQPRQGISGLGGLGIGGLPGVTSKVRTVGIGNKPAAASDASPNSVVQQGGSAPGQDQQSSQAPASQQDVVGPKVALQGDDASYLASLQRTINCLADPDRSLRRTAATTLQTKLLSGDASTPRATPAQLQALLSGPLLRPLVSLLSDQLERCRLVSLAILLDGCRQLPDSSALLPELLPALARRYGALPVQEAAEEIRVQIVQLTSLLLSTSQPSHLSRYIPEVASIVCRGLEDGFPDLKKAACTCTEQLAALARGRPASSAPGAPHPSPTSQDTTTTITTTTTTPDASPATASGATATATASAISSALDGEAEKLLASLVPNLQHQHSRVRLAAMAALDALVGPGAGGVRRALLEEVVVPALRPLAHDRAQGVREAMFSAAARWMGYTAGEAPEAAADGQGGVGGEGGNGAAAAAASQLLPLLLVGVTDPQPATASLALSLVEGVGAVWLREHQQQGRKSSNEEVNPMYTTSDEEGQGREGRSAQGGDEEEGVVAVRLEASRLGAPYSGRPGVGCRAMVVALLPQHLPPLARQLGEWTAALRVAAARSLHTTLVMSEGAAAAHAQLLLSALCSAIADEEVEVASTVMSCCHVLGAHVPPAAWLPRLVDTLGAGGSSNTTTSSSATAAGVSSGLSTSQLTHTLVVLSGLIHAAGRARQPLAPELLRSLAACLASDGMLAAAAEHAAVRQQLLAAAVNAMAWAGAAAGGDAAVVLPLHVVLLQLYGSELAAATAAATAAPSSGGAGGAAAASGGGAGRRQGEGSKVWEALGTLAACCGAEGVEALTDRHARWLVGCLFPGAASEGGAAAMDAGPGSGPEDTSAPAFAWSPNPGDAAWLCVLRAVLLTASPAALRRLAAPLVGALRPLLAAAAAAREDGGREEAPAGLRLALLGLVDSVLEDAERGRALAEGAGQALLRDVLMPPLVWQAGKTAAAVRYAAVTALATLLGSAAAATRGDPAAAAASAAASPSQASGHAGNANGGSGAAASPSTPGTPLAAAGTPLAGHLVAAAEGGGLLPLLSSCLDEDWYTDMRLAACYVVEQLLQVAGPQLSDTSRRALYPELHKRLDDAHNSVRCAACRALCAFVRSAGSSYCDTNSGYLVAGVVIHMDDSDPAVQEAACAVLLEAAAAKPAVTAAEVAKLRDRFRSKHYIERVLAACAAAQAAQGSS